MQEQRGREIYNEKDTKEMDETGCLSGGTISGDWWADRGAAAAWCDGADRGKRYYAAECGALQAG